MSEVVYIQTYTFQGKETLQLYMIKIEIFTKEDKTVF